MGVCPPRPVCVFTTLEEEMVTTAGNTFFTTGAKPVRLGPSFASAKWNDAGGLAFKARSTPAMPRPPRPSARDTASTAALGCPKSPFSFIYPPIPMILVGRPPGDHRNCGLIDMDAARPELVCTVKLVGAASGTVYSVTRAVLLDLYHLLPLEGAKILLVLFLSFLTGLEREEHRAGSESYSFGGVRTFPLIGLIGYAVSLLSGGQALPVVLGFAVVGGFLMLSYRQKLATSKLAGVTSEMSALTTYLVGALVFREQFWIATTLSVADRK